MRQRKYLTKNPKKIGEIIMLVLDEAFDKKVSRLRRDFLGWQPLPPLNGKLFAARKLNRSKAELDRAIGRLLKKFELPTTWFDLVKQYVLTNDFVPEGHYDPDGVVVEVETHKKGTKPKEAHLVLHNRLTKEAVVKAWDKIRKELDTSAVRKRKRIPDQFERDYEITKLRESGKSLSEIYRIISKKYKKDIDFGVLKNAETKTRKRLNMGGKKRNR